MQKVQRLKKTKKRKRVRRKINLPSSSQNHGRQRTNAVVNLSKLPLSDGEMSLLSKGLFFFPKPHRFKTFQLKQNFKDFTQRLRLRKYFFDPLEENGDTEIDQFRKK